MIAVCVILADADWLTCDRCRACVPQGQVCLCRARTHGPSIEPVLMRIVTGRRKVQNVRRISTPGGPTTRRESG